MTHYHIYIKYYYIRVKHSYKIYSILFKYNRTKNLHFKIHTLKLIYTEKYKNDM